MLRKQRPSCLVCQKEVNEIRYRFCGNKCQRTYCYWEWKERYLAGLKTGQQSAFGVSNNVRRFLIERDGEACKECGWCAIHPVTGNIPIQVHHIDGNWANCRPDNLVLLCPNCHSLTPTHGGLNRGNGRTARYKKTLI